MSQIEVEKRVILHVSQVEQLEQRIYKLHPDFQPVEELKDIYFCPNTVTAFSQIPMDEIGEYSLRLRQKRSGRTETVELNVKVITTKSDLSAWKEHEITIDSLHEGYAILLAIGFKPFFILKKKRKTFSLEQRNMHICLEDIDGFGPILEVEILTTQENAQTAKEEIDRLFEELHIASEQIVPKTVNNMLMQRDAIFDNSITLETILSN